MSTQRRRVLENSGLIIPADGVYIEGLDRKLYTVSNWNGGYDGDAANSVIVASGDVKFRIALTESPTYMKISSEYSDPLEDSMTAISDESVAKGDYDGAVNTANMLKIVSSSDSYAPGYCNRFIFPDGKTKGFLPSLGQLNLMYQSKAAVDAALSACGGTAMNTSSSDYYWSSTFYGVEYNILRSCWMLRWSDGSVVNVYLNSELYARPFANIF